MSALSAGLSGPYLSVLRAHVAGAGEASLLGAYDLGREALDGAWSVMALVSVHYEALARLLEQVATPAEGARAARSAGQIAMESLSVFEMALCGYREANAELGRTNQQLRDTATELAALAEAERLARLELQRADQHLKVAQAQLARSARLASLGQLVAGVAHEINNPLAFVMNNNAVLQRDVRALCKILRLYQAEDEGLRAHRPAQHQAIRDLCEYIDLPHVLGSLEELLPRSQDGLRRIQRIVEDLRTFARTEEPGSSHQEDAVDLGRGIRSTLEIARGRARERRVMLAAELSPLPPVTCAAGKINQVILNLVTNAIDACPAGGQVTVRAAPAGADEVEIHVIDTGAGIDPAILDRLFDPFFTTKPPGQGTGLGLSISHRIIEEHGGRIEVDAAPGQGAHFVVHLPIRSPGAKGPPGRPATSPGDQP